MTDDRGQGYTLEAVVASILLIGGLVFALQATAVTPLSASTSSQHIENQQQATAEGILKQAARTGDLRVAVLNWDVSTKKFYEADENYYVGPPANDFGDLLQRSFAGDGIVYNVYLTYETASNDRRRVRLAYQGEPSDNTVSASRSIVLFDGDETYDADEQPTGTTLSSTGSFWAPDAAPSSSVYNVVRVEVVAWRQ